MMAQKAKASTKILYSMGEVCEMFDLPASTIRFWEKNFAQVKPKKNAKGNRLFTPEDVEILKVIYHLVKEKGMTLAGADKYLKDSRMAARQESSVVEILERIKSTLIQIRGEIVTYENQQQDEIVIKEQCDESEEMVAKPKYVELSLFD